MLSSFAVKEECASIRSKLVGRGLGKPFERRWFTTTERMLAARSIVKQMVKVKVSPRTDVFAQLFIYTKVSVITATIYILIFFFHNSYDFIVIIVVLCFFKI